VSTGLEKSQRRVGRSLIIRTDIGFRAGDGRVGNNALERKTAQPPRCAGPRWPFVGCVRAVLRPWHGGVPLPARGTSPAPVATLAGRYKCGGIRQPMDSSAAVLATASSPLSRGDNRGVRPARVRTSERTKCPCLPPAKKLLVRAERPIPEFPPKQRSELTSNVPATLAHRRDASAARMCSA